MITKNLSTCKSASTKLVHPINIGSGNIIPQWWYSKILTACSKACAIDIFPSFESGIYSLQFESGHEFNTNFINQLLLRLANKYPDHKFPSKSAVMAYMSKILKYEMRQALQVNNESFKCAPQDKKSVNIEKFLQSVKNCKKTDQISQLRRKIAGIFEPQLAYSLLCSSYFKLTNTGKLFINTSNAVVLDKTQERILLSAAKTVFCDFIASCSVVMRKQEPNNSIESAETPKQSSVELVEDTAIWSKIRQQMKLHYGEAIDKSWFNELEEVRLDNTTNTLILKASTGFIRDWIKSNYLFTLERLAKGMFESVSYAELIS